MSIIKKIFITLARVVFYVSVIPVFLLAVALIALQTGPVREMATRFIEDAVARDTGVVCRIDKLSGNLISRFEIKGLEIKEATTDISVLSAEMIEASYSIPMLLRRTLRINRMTVSGARVRLVQKKDGSWNFESLALRRDRAEDASEVPPADSSFPGFRIKLRRLTITDSDVSVTELTDAGESTRHFKGIECRARLDVGQQITADIKSLAVRATYPRLDIRDLSGNVRFDPDVNRLFFNSVRIVGKNADFTVNGRLAFAHGPDAHLLDMIVMDLGADIQKMPLGEFGRAFSVQMPDSDIVAGNISVKGPVSKMDCRLDLQMDDLRLKSQGLVTIDESYDVGLDISGKFSGLDLAALPVLELDFLPGRLNAGFSLLWRQIGMPEQSGTIDLDVKSSELLGYRIEKAGIDTRIEGPDFIFEKLNVDTPLGKLSGTGRLTGFMDGASDNLIQLAADLKGIKPEKLLPNSHFSGHLNGILGAVVFIPKTFIAEEITADASCRIRDSRIMDLDIASADIDAVWRNGKMTLDRFAIASEIGTTSASGWVSVRDETLNLRLSGDFPHITSVKPYIVGLMDGSEHLSGSASLTADIIGKWQAMEIQANLNAEKLLVKNVFADSLAFHGQWSGSITNFKDFRATAQCVVDNIHRDKVNIPVMKLKTTCTPSVIHGEINLQGEQDESFLLSGSIRQWLEPVKEVIIDRVFLVLLDQPPLVNRDPVILQISEDRITVDSLHMDSGEASLSLTGVAGIQPPREIEANLVLRDFNLKRISGFLENTLKIQGRLSSDLRISGFLENPIVQMTASVKEASQKEWPDVDISVGLDYQGTQVNLSGTVVRRGRQFMDISGSASADLALLPFSFALQPESFLASVHMNQVDISWISDIINDPEYDVSGVFNAEATFAGNFFNPGIKGRLQLDQGTLTLKNQGLVYETLNARLRFEKDTITIDHIHINSDKEGSVTLSGDLTHENFKPRKFNIRAVGDQLYIPFHSGVDARINPDLRLSGTWEAPVLSGRVDVPEGRVNLERFLEKTYSEIEIVAPVVPDNGVLQIPEKEPEPLEFVDPLTADIDVAIPKDFWFRGQDEYIEIKGNVRLKKKPHKPFVLYGSVMPVRGTYRFRGRLFQITRGELTFTGQEDINPFLDIEAESTINDVKIIIRLTGTFEQINLVLGSEPAMDQAAIISYLIFGRSPDDLSEKESFQAGEAALSYTGQIAADKLRDIIGDTLGIDYLSISAGSGGLRQGSLTMGKYVLPRVFVTFRQGFDETVTQKLEVTYEINKHFDLETQIDNEQTSAVDLIWKYDF